MGLDGDGDGALLDGGDDAVRIDRCDLGAGGGPREAAGRTGGLQRRIERQPAAHVQGDGALPVEEHAGGLVGIDDPHLHLGLFAIGGLCRDVHAVIGFLVGRDGGAAQSGRAHAHTGLVGGRPADRRICVCGINLSPQVCQAVQIHGHDFPVYQPSAIVVDGHGLGRGNDVDYNGAVSAIRSLRRDGRAADRLRLHPALVVDRRNAGSAARPAQRPVAQQRTVDVVHLQFAGDALGQRALAFDSQRSARPGSAASALAVDVAVVLEDAFVGAQLVSIVAAIEIQNNFSVLIVAADSAFRAYDVLPVRIAGRIEGGMPVLLFVDELVFVVLRHEGGVLAAVLFTEAAGPACSVLIGVLLLDRNVLVLSNRPQDGVAFPADVLHLGDVYVVSVGILVYRSARAVIILHLIATAVVIDDARVLVRTCSALKNLDPHGRASRCRNIDVALTVRALGICIDRYTYICKVVFRFIPAEMNPAAGFQRHIQTGGMINAEVIVVFRGRGHNAVLQQISIHSEALDGIFNRDLRPCRGIALLAELCHAVDVHVVNAQRSEDPAGDRDLIGVGFGFIQQLVAGIDVHAVSDRIRQRIPSQRIIPVPVSGTLAAADGAKHRLAKVRLIVDRDGLRIAEQAPAAIVVALHLHAARAGDVEGFAEAGLAAAHGMLRANVFSIRQNAHLGGVGRAHIEGDAVVKARIDAGLALGEAYGFGCFVQALDLDLAVASLIPPDSAGIILSMNVQVVCPSGREGYVKGGCSLNAS